MLKRLTVPSYKSHGFNFDGGRRMSMKVKKVKKFGTPAKKYSTMTHSEPFSSELRIPKKKTPHFQIKFMLPEQTCLGEKN